MKRDRERIRPKLTDTRDTITTHCNIAAMGQVAVTGTRTQGTRRRTCSSSDQGSLCVSCWNAREGC
ncbi:hypothetical protein I314_04228 [Cryptococcus bacillisporus CA1873]|uniref:Unplaced genomic scaffold supercont1.11, whole genome shotgun sequence n=2 Tax=Cryptococcus gattii TaxID=552467 RepID=A0A0D0TJQ8_CRYGA|nr:hypothetical protein I312_04156 [Cryptococcus bacillisporus CA1280]KIR59795.1 hypothetical protein I314_04228 [Cryptococcus bacillisporus CA1873]|eukprot:KIR59795.1 hypothetical protein I314_04228 [Cryptococcus gattii CA1873]